MRSCLAVALLCSVACQSREKATTAAGSGSAPPAPAVAVDAAPRVAVVDAGAPVANAPRGACDTVSLQIDSAGTWLGAAPDTRCFAPRKAGALDAAWLGAELARLRAAIDAKTCPSSVEVAAGGDAKFDEVLSAIDAARRAGFADASFAPSAALAMTFTGTPPAASSCTNAPTLAPKTVALAPAAVRASDKMRVSPSTPVVVVTAAGILVNRKQVATIAEAGTGEGPLASIATAIGKPSGGRTMILQAERDIPARIVQRIATTARQAGYEDVIFAPKL